MAGEVESDARNRYESEAQIPWHLIPFVAVRWQ